jgi:hypothetical protein
VLNVVLRVIHSFIDPPEDFLAGQRNDAFVIAVANYRVALARASLTVSKETCVITFKGIVEDLLTLLNIRT